MDRAESLARCGYCGDVYDLLDIDVTSRRTDCSVWKTPCCGRQADDRGETGWTLRQCYTRVIRRPYVDIFGQMHDYTPAGSWG